MSKVTFPNPEAETLNDALGISKERRAQIVEALGRAYESEPDVFKVSSLIKNTLDLANITSANEVLYLGQILGMLIGKNWD